MSQSWFRAPEGKLEAITEGEELTDEQEQKKKADEQEQKKKADELKKIKLNF